MSEAAVSEQRKDFSKIRSFMDLPNLIDVQRRSYERFLQMNLLPEEREESGLQAVFTSVFPFADFRGTCALEFVKYAIGNWECKCGRLKGLEHLRMDCRNCGARIMTAHPHEEIVSCHKCGAQNPNKVSLCDVCGNPVDLQMKYSVAECQERGMTYSVPLKVTFRLFVYDKDPDTGVKTMRDAKEEEVFFGDIPLMTEHGTFIINGTERVIVSQLHRSPGVFFTKESAHGFLAKIIPYRGSWVEFEYDQKGVLFVRIDRKRKFPATIFLRALGLETDESILRQFYIARAGAVRARPRLPDGRPRTCSSRRSSGTATPASKRETKPVFAGIKLSLDDQKEIAEEGRRSSGRVDESAVEKACFLADVVDLSTGEVLFEAGQELGRRRGRALKERGIKDVEIFFPDWDLSTDVLVNTIRKDTHKTRNEAILEIYRRLRPGDPPTYESAKNLFEGMFFDPKKYDFSRVGRFKFNIKLEAESRGGHADADARRHLPRRRVPPAAEARRRPDGRHRQPRQPPRPLGGRAAREPVPHRPRPHGARHQGEDVRPPGHRLGDAARPDQLQARHRVDQGVLRVLAAVAVHGPDEPALRGHAQAATLGPRAGRPVARAGGVRGPRRPPDALRPRLPDRDAGRPEHRPHLVAVVLRPDQRLRLHRDPVQEGREGPRHRPLPGHVRPATRPSSSARSSRSGTSRRRTSASARNHKRAADAVPFAFYLSAWEEENYVIAQANAETDASGRIREERVIARFNGEFITAERDKVDYKDISPKQLVSVATALIPFLEHDDANRALMGSNMQRQAVPLLKVESPLVGTGLEATVARDSGAVVLAKRGGIVDQVDSERIIVRVEGGPGETGDGGKEFGADIYPLTKFRRSNQNTCINQKPIVQEGSRVERGEVLADGPCTSQGELALGRNVLVAFMPWRGYNYEDAILVSERLVKDDFFTSIHIEEFDIEARDTKLGPEEITRDIPNVSENALRDLDESGIIRIGGERQAGRHPGRQGHAEGRDPADARGEAAARDLRREGRRRARRLAEVPAGHRGHDRRRQDLLPQGHRQGPPGPGDRAGPDRQDREEHQGRDPDHPRGSQQEDPRPARRAGGRRGRQRPRRQRDRQEGRQVHRRGRRPAARRSSSSA